MAKTEAILPEIIPADIAMAATVRGEMDSQITTAKNYPRSVSVALKEIEALCTKDRETAESCWYAIPRSGKTIEGPSARFAEIVAYGWQNIRVQGQQIAIDATTVTVRGSAIDLERNVGASSDVSRRITDSKGRRFSPDMIAVTTNAAISIATRNAIFKIVPRALFKGVLDTMRKVAMGDERTLEARRTAAMAYFEGIGVKRADILKTIQCKDVEDISLTHLQTLRGIMTAIQDGEVTAESAFNLKQSSGAAPSGPDLDALRGNVKPSTPETPQDATGAPSEPPDAPSDPEHAGDLLGDTGPSDVASLVADKDIKEAAFGCGMNSDDIRELSEAYADHADPKQSILDEIYRIIAEKNEE